MPVSFSADDVAREVLPALDDLAAQYRAGVALPDRSPLYATNPQGAIVDRDGHIIRGPLEPVAPAKAG